MFTFPRQKRLGPHSISFSIFSILFLLVLFVVCCAGISDICGTGLDSTNTPFNLLVNYNTVCGGSNQSCITGDLTSRAMTPLCSCSLGYVGLFCRQTAAIGYSATVGNNLNQLPTYLPPGTPTTSKIYELFISSIVVQVNQPAYAINTGVECITVLRQVSTANNKFTPMEYVISKTCPKDTNDVVSSFSTKQLLASAGVESLEEGAYQIFYKQSLAITPELFPGGIRTAGNKIKKLYSEAVVSVSGSLTPTTFHFVSPIAWQRSAPSIARKTCSIAGTLRTDFTTCVCDYENGYYGKYCDQRQVLTLPAVYTNLASDEDIAFLPFDVPTAWTSWTNQTLVGIPTFLTIGPSGLVTSPGSAAHVITTGTNICGVAAYGDIAEDIFVQYRLGVWVDTSTTITARDEFNMVQNLPQIYALTRPITWKCFQSPLYRLKYFEQVLYNKYTKTNTISTFYHLPGIDTSLAITKFTPTTAGAVPTQYGCKASFFGPFCEFQLNYDAEWSTTASSFTFTITRHSLMLDKRLITINPQQVTISTQDGAVLVNADTTITSLSLVSEESLAQNTAFITLTFATDAATLTAGTHTLQLSPTIDGTVVSFNLPLTVTNSASTSPSPCANGGTASYSNTVLSCVCTNGSNAQIVYFGTYCQYSLDTADKTKFPSAYPGQVDFVFKVGYDVRYSSGDLRTYVVHNKGKIVMPRNVSERGSEEMVKFYLSDVSSSTLPGWDATVVSYRVSLSATPTNDKNTVYLMLGLTTPIPYTPADYFLAQVALQVSRDYGVVFLKNMPIMSRVNPLIDSLYGCVGGSQPDLINIAKQNATVVAFDMHHLMSLDSLYGVDATSVSPYISGHCKCPPGSYGPRCQYGVQLKQGPTTSYSLSSNLGFWITSRRVEYTITHPSNVHFKSTNGLHKQCTLLFIEQNRTTLEVLMDTKKVISDCHGVATAETGVDFLYQFIIPADTDTTKTHALYLNLDGQMIELYKNIQVADYLQFVDVAGSEVYSVSSVNCYFSGSLFATKYDGVVYCHCKEIDAYFGPLCDKQLSGDAGKSAWKRDTSAFSFNTIFAGQNPETNTILLAVFNGNNDESLEKSQIVLESRVAASTKTWAASGAITFTWDELLTKSDSLINSIDLSQPSQFIYQYYSAAGTMVHVYIPFRIVSIEKYSNLLVETLSPYSTSTIQRCNAVGTQHNAKTFTTFLTTGNDNMCSCRIDEANAPLFFGSVCDIYIDREVEDVPYYNRYLSKEIYSTSDLTPAKITAMFGFEFVFNSASYAAQISVIDTTRYSSSAYSANKLFVVFNNPFTTTLGSAATPTTIALSVTSTENSGVFDLFKLYPHGSIPNQLITQCSYSQYIAKRFMLDYSGSTDFYSYSLAQYQGCADTSLCLSSTLIANPIIAADVPAQIIQCGCAGGADEACLPKECSDISDVFHAALSKIGVDIDPAECIDLVFQQDQDLAALGITDPNWPTWKKFDEIIWHTAGLYGVKVNHQVASQYLSLTNIQFNTTKAPISESSTFYVNPSFAPSTTTNVILNAAVLDNTGVKAFSIDSIQIGQILVPANGDCELFQKLGQCGLPTTLNNVATCSFVSFKEAYTLRQDSTHISSPWCACASGYVGGDCSVLLSEIGFLSSKQQTDGAAIVVRASTTTTTPFLSTQTLSGLAAIRRLTPDSAFSPKFQLIANFVTLATITADAANTYFWPAMNNPYAYPNSGHSFTLSVQYALYLVDQYVYVTSVSTHQKVYIGFDNTVALVGAKQSITALNTITLRILPPKPATAFTEAQLQQQVQIFVTYSGADDLIQYPVHITTPSTPVIQNAIALPLKYFVSSSPDEPVEVNITLPFINSTTPIATPSMSVLVDSVITGLVYQSSALTPQCSSTSCQWFDPSPTALASSTTCPIKCPKYMSTNDDCTACVCKTQQCAVYTRGGMMYLEKQATGFPTSVFSTMLPWIFKLELKLNKLPASLLKQEGTATSTTDNNYHNTVGTEQITFLPLNFYSTDFSTLQFFITITPFNNSITTSQINSRFEILFKQYSTYLLSKTPAGSNNWYLPTTKTFEIFNLPIQPIIAPFVDDPTTLTAPSAFATFSVQTATTTTIVTATPPTAQTTALTTQCVTTAIGAIMKNTCPTLQQLTSTMWLTTQCDGTITTMRTLQPQCYDLFNAPMSYASGVNSWCATGFNMFPKALETPCLPPTTAPIIPTPVTTLKTFTLTSITTSSSSTTIEVDGVITATQVNLLDRVQIVWSCDATADGTMSIFLKNSFPQGSTSSISYDVLLLTTLANLQSATFIIPGNLKLTTADGHPTQIQFSVQYNPNIKFIKTSAQISLYDDINLCIDATTGSGGDVCTDHSLCNKYTGVCTDCEEKYIPHPLSPGKCILPCDASVNPCQHGLCSSLLNSTTRQYSPTCECNSGWSGITCNQNFAICSAETIQRCNSHGQVLLVDIDQPTAAHCQKATCHCENRWTSSDIANGQECDVCVLKTECNLEGTDESSYIRCDKCTCKHGYSGNDCSQRSLYGVIEFSGQPASSKKLQQHYQPLSTSFKMLSLSKEKIVEQFFASTSEPMIDTSDLLSLQGKQSLERDLALSLNLDVENVKLIRLSRTWNGSILQTFETTAKSTSKTKISALFEIISTTQTEANPTSFALLDTSAINKNLDNTSPIESLYEQWLRMQNNANKKNTTDPTQPITPIENTQSQQELGGMNGVNGGYDPNCDESTAAAAGSACPAGNDPFKPLFDKDTKNTSATVVIAIVVPLGVVILLFIGIAVSVSYCRKEQRACFAPAKKNDKKSHRSRPDDHSHLDLGEASTSSPSTVGSTISLMPMSPTSGSVNTADSIKSVNNHTEVYDESLVGTDWKAYKDAKHQMFYVNQVTMQSKWKHPIKENDGADDKGW